MKVSDSTILRKIERQPKHAAGFKQLVREFGLHGEDRRELCERLRGMVKKGELIQVDSDRYAMPQAKVGKNMAVGRLTMHRDGYGFVIPGVEVVRHGRVEPFLHARPTLTSTAAQWAGLALEGFSVPACVIPRHEPF